MLQDIWCLSGYKSKTCVQAAYKKLTSDLKVHRDKVRRWKDIPSKSKAGVAIRVSDKIFYCYKRQGHYIIIKGSVQENNYIYIYIYIYAPNIGAPKYPKYYLFNKTILRQKGKKVTVTQ